MELEPVGVAATVRGSDADAPFKRTP
jgi:hypothetical protein